MTTYRSPPRWTPSTWKRGGLLVGAWLTGVVPFLILAAVVYYLIVKPYTAAKER